MSIERHDVKALSGHIAEGLEKADHKTSFVAILSEANQKLGSSDLHDAFQDAVADVAIGYPLSTALGKHPRVFDGPFLAAVRQGEQTGALDETLRRFADSDFAA